MICAIETSYAGVRFRSRLEARWALFLDALNIRWEYEPEAFRLTEGDCYTPDFYLPAFEGGIYAEVKPVCTRAAYDKALRLARDIRKPVWACSGVPDFKVTSVFNLRHVELDQLLDKDEEIADARLVQEIDECAAGLLSLDIVSGLAHSNALYRHVARQDLKEAGVANFLWARATTVIPCADQAEGENRFFYEPGYEDSQGYFDPEYAGQTYRNAIKRLKAHRFWEPSAA
jgi:hypothetical protein